MDEVTGYWRKLHNKAIHNLNQAYSRNIISILESKRVKLARHMARTGE
jgi:hypothetical protein